MNSARSRPGYVFLVTVLLVGAVTSALVASMLLLATSASRSSLSIARSAEAIWLARSCAERALLAMRGDGGYAGGETFARGDGSCAIKEVGGEGNADRTLCVEGTSGGVTRRLEIRIVRLIPIALIRSWTEVSAFHLCPE